MSLRPMIYAADLAPLLRMVETSDVSLADQAGEKFFGCLMDRGDWTKASAREEVRRLFSGHYFGKPETEYHVIIVRCLAELLGMMKNESLVADGGWKARAWVEYAEHVYPQLAKWPGELLTALFGRPLFGLEIDSSWSYYSYLRHAEVGELRTALDAVDDWPDDDDWLRKFHEALCGWLHAVENRKTDLWLYAY